MVSIDSPRPPLTHLLTTITKYPLIPHPHKTPNSFDPMAVVEHDRAALQRYLPKRAPSRKPVPRTERSVRLFGCFLVFFGKRKGGESGVFLRGVCVSCCCLSTHACFPPFPF